MRTEEGVNNKVGKTPMKRKGVIHYRREERGEKGEWESRRRAATIIALSYHCTVINSLLVGGVSALAEAGPMMNHLHPAPAIYDRETNMSWPGNQLGLVFGSHCHRVTTPK